METSKHANHLKLDSFPNVCNDVRLWGWNLSNIHFLPFFPNYTPWYWLSLSVIIQTELAPIILQTDCVCLWVCAEGGGVSIKQPWKAEIVVVSIHFHVCLSNKLYRFQQVFMVWTVLEVCLCVSVGLFIMIFESSLILISYWNRIVFILSQKYIWSVLSFLSGVHVCVCGGGSRNY